MVTRWIIAALVVASGPASAQAADDFPVHVGLDCGGAALALTLQGESGRLYYSGAEMPMARARSGSGVKFDSIDDPETYVWTKGDEAMVRIAGQDLEGCRVSRVSRVTEGAWQLQLPDGTEPEDGTTELAFGPEGRLSGATGCGGLTGRWTAGEGGALSLEVAAEGGESCAPEDADRQSALLAALRAVTGVGFSPEGALELRAGDETRLVATH
ncbi:META domain-containing protein [Alloyangia pacifica]|uniref:META domain-containing protein n=1 Tax=Alloyangia pacifica TaxID=311180 RepID=UPI001CFDFA5F|nr:META domain-containing protein [Alloyangia pacifica]